VFRQWLLQVEYSNEDSILSMLPNLDVTQQVLLDKRLHRDAIARGTFGLQGSMLARDSQWKDKVIDIVTGKEKSPKIIEQVISLIKKDIASHQNRLPDVKTGSLAWHETWIRVYQEWLKKIEEIRAQTQ
jgi:hypothetical protein